MDEQGGGNQNTCRYMQIHAYMDRKYMILTCQYPIDVGMYYVSICKYFGKYLQVFLSRYVEIDQVVFHKNTYSILTNRFTDGGSLTSGFLPPTMLYVTYYVVRHARTTSYVQRTTSC